MEQKDLRAQNVVQCWRTHLQIQLETRLIVLMGSTLIRLISSVRVVILAETTENSLLVAIALHVMAYIK
jgi:hypothetical protein